VADAFARRREAGLAVVACAEAAADMAARFGGGGKLIAFGNGAGSTDAQHIAVEFIHPVIVGKRACDLAVLAWVIGLFERHMAAVDAGGPRKDVSVELVDAGMSNLVHAEIAIGTLDELGLV
jgi:hypothetical protein